MIVCDVSNSMKKETGPGVTRIDEACMGIRNLVEDLFHRRCHQDHVEVWTFSASASVLQPRAAVTTVHAKLDALESQLRARVHRGLGTVSPAQLYAAFAFHGGISVLGCGVQDCRSS